MEHDEDSDLRTEFLGSATIVRSISALSIRPLQGESPAM
jgi:hypothetical protein